MGISHWIAFFKGFVIFSSGMVLGFRLETLLVPIVVVPSSQQCCFHGDVVAVVFCYCARALIFTGTLIFLFSRRPR